MLGEDRDGTDKEHAASHDALKATEALPSAKECAILMGGNCLERRDGVLDGALCRLQRHVPNISSFVFMCAILPHFPLRLCGGLTELACISPFSRVADSSFIEKTVSAMRAMRFSAAERVGLFDALASLLHLGNVKFEDGVPGETTNVAGGDRDDEQRSSPLSLAAKVLGVVPHELRSVMTTRKRDVKEETFVSSLTGTAARNLCDAVMKALYGKLFGYVVSRVNEAIRAASAEVGDKAIDAGSTEAGGGGSLIGILDIFGFEVFKENSFAQLMINYTNERLQSQFNDFIFKFEQQL